MVWNEPLMRLEEITCAFGDSMQHDGLSPCHQLKYLNKGTCVWIRHYLCHGDKIHTHRPTANGTIPDKGQMSKSCDNVNVQYFTIEIQNVVRR